MNTALIDWLIDLVNATLVDWLIIEQLEAAADLEDGEVSEPEQVRQAKQTIR